MRGFTLLELLIVIVILGLIFAITVPTFENYRTSQTFDQTALNLEETLSVARNYAASNVTASSSNAQTELSTSGRCSPYAADFIGYGVSIPDSKNNSGNTSYSLDIVFTCPTTSLYFYYPDDLTKWVISMPVNQNISFASGTAAHIVFPFLNGPVAAYTSSGTLTSSVITLQNNSTPPLTKTITVSSSGVITMN